MFQSVKEDILILGKRIKSEIIKLILVLLVSIILSIVIFILMKNILYSVLCFAIGLIVDVYIVTNYSTLKRKLLDLRDDEFIQMISYFEIFINNHFTVYQSFSLLTPYASKWMEEKLDILIDGIDNDKSITPFIEFANNFKLNIAQNIMISIYQMVDQGDSKEQLNQFSLLFDQLNESKEKSLIDKHERELSKVDALPLIATGAMTILITLCILFLMGDIINVI